jgi:cobalamin biosynthesis protein CobD/CbiB
MKTKIIFFIFFFLFFLTVNAQCAMCRAVLESEESQTAAEGINDGIVYLMAIPYLLVGGLGYFIYRKYNTLKK